MQVAPGGTGQELPEELVPGGIHTLEQAGQIVGIGVAVPVGQALTHLLPPSHPEPGPPGPLHIGRDGVPDQRQRLAHPLMVGDRHCLDPFQSLRHRTRGAGQAGDVVPGLNQPVVADRILRPALAVGYLVEEVGEAARPVPDSTTDGA